jgi:ubiquinone/menaquinone biosynthesis C-methylase UbiE
MNEMIFMRGKEYFEYLKNRSWLSFLFRKYFYKPIIKEFNGKVLDIGCGLGEFLEEYSNSSGIDINSYCVNYCKEKGLDVKIGSATKIPYKDKSFNGIFCLCVLEHLKRSENAIKEMYRVLKSNGKLVLIVPTECGFRRDKTHIKFWDKDNVRELLEKFNFKVESMKYFPFSFKFLRERIYFNELRIIARKV